MEETHGPPGSIDWLRAELAQRRQKNRLFSQRAFARYLKIPSGRLSEILSGKRALSPQMAEKIAQRLSLSPPDRARLLERTKAQSAETKRIRSWKLTGPASAEYFSLKEDSFEAMASWQHFALLSLMNTKDFQSDVNWVAARLGITAEETRGALDRLVRLQLIRLTAEGWVRTHRKLKTTEEIACRALKRFHQELLRRAGQAVDTVPIPRRNSTGITMAIDPAKMPLAKALIDRFEDSLSDLLEGGERQEVYQLTIDLFPLTQREIS